MNNRDSIVEVRHTKSLVEDAAKSAITSITIKKATIKKKRDELEKLLMQNNRYEGLKENAKDLSKERSELRKTLLKQPKLATLDVEIKELNSGVRERQLSLFDYLGQYVRDTGAKEITDLAGLKYEIQIEHKIKI